ncbi:MAG: macro domain-containing protein [Eubacteriaceae bacterium]|nr:macro domain-containing protein [Eubacteriaceae bacterium]
MVEFVTGNFFDNQAEAIVNIVNCVGVSGRGIARGFRERYPENFDLYEVACGKGEVVLGKMFVFETFRLRNPMYIINFPTKNHWRSLVRLEDIQTGLEDLVAVVTRLGVSSLALPAVGVGGFGGLEWDDVRGPIHSALMQLPSEIKIDVYEPDA